MEKLDAKNVNNEKGGLLTEIMLSKTNGGAPISQEASEKMS